MLLLSLLLQAFTHPADKTGQMMFSDSHTWVFEKLLHFRRAELLMSGGGDLPFASPYHLSRDWLQALPQRWPHANSLPRRVLRTCGCQSANASLASMIRGGQRPHPPCREDLAIFEVRRFYAYSSRCRREGCQTFADGRDLDFFTMLRPRLRLRPVFPGQGHGVILLQLVLERHVHDPTGLFLEFGVFQGATLNVTARHLEALGGGTVYGFDSFQGLPEAFRGGAGADDHRDRGEDVRDLPVGQFRLERPPAVEPSAELVVGYFNETLPGFLEGRLPAAGGPPPQPLRLLHIDCDLASSTLEVLTALAPLLAEGSIVVLDDFVNFRGFRTAALQGFQDFVASGLAPGRLEVLAAPWNVFKDNEVAQDYRGWQPDQRFDTERAVAFRVL